MTQSCIYKCFQLLRYIFAWVTPFITCADTIKKVKLFATFITQIFPIQPANLIMGSCSI